MGARIDHWIVKVNDLEESVAFWTRTLRLTDEGRDGPFAVLRVDADTTIQLAPWGTEGNEHFAFRFPPAEFDAIFAELREAGVEYGDSFHNVGTNTGPGRELGAHGVGETIYFLDPNRHLLEIRTHRDSG